MALKIFTIDLSGPEAEERFKAECKATATVRHPNIVVVHDAGKDAAGHAWLAMDLFERGSLADAVHLRGPLDVDEVLRIGIRVAGAMASAHLAQIIHRDVKPENILLAATGEPALADFGIAIVSDQRGPLDSASAFTFAHAAPEVLQGGRASFSSDVYGLASTIWTLLSGDPPFCPRADERPVAFIHRVAVEPVQPLARSDVPAVLSEILARALAKDPAQRPTAADFARHLQRVQEDMGMPVTEAQIIARQETFADWSSTYVFRPELRAHAKDGAPVGVRGRRTNKSVALVAAAAVLVAGGLGYWLFGRSSASPPTGAVALTTPPSSTVSSSTIGLPAPTNVKIKVSPTAVELSWQAPNIGNPAYAITVRPALAKLPDLVPSGKTTATVTGLDTGHKSYCFVVTAVYLKRDGTAITSNSLEVCSAASQSGTAGA